LARKGAFGTSTTPFGSGAPLSDLSVYKIGGAQASPVYFGGGGAPAGPPAGYGEGWSTTYENDGRVTYAPPKPTVAPAVGVMPEPAIPWVAAPVQPLEAAQAHAAVVAAAGRPDLAAREIAAAKSAAAAASATLEQVQAAQDKATLLAMMGRPDLATKELAKVGL